MVTKQQDAIDGANESVNYAQQLMNLFKQIQSFDMRFAQRAYQLAWNLQTTYVQNDDGSQGDPDASPNVAHPIAGLNISANDLGTISGVVSDFKKFMNNEAVSTSDRIAILSNKLAQ